MRSPAYCTHQSSGNDCSGSADYKSTPKGSGVCSPWEQTREWRDDYSSHYIKKSIRIFNDAVLSLINFGFIFDAHWSSFTIWENTLHGRVRKRGRRFECSHTHNRLGVCKYPSWHREGQLGGTVFEVWERLTWRALTRQTAGWNERSSLQKAFRADQSVCKWTITEPCLKMFMFM